MNDRKVEVTFWQIAVMYEVKFGVPMPPDLPYEKAINEVRAAYSDNKNGFYWLLYQGEICLNAKVSIPEAVKVIKGRIEYDETYGSKV